MIDQITGETYLYEEVSPQGYLFKWRGDYVMFYKLQIGDNLYNLFTTWFGHERNCTFDHKS